MSAVALSKTLAPSTLSSSLAPASAASAPAKGFFTRMWDAIIISRTAQAEREVARYLALRDPASYR